MRKINLILISILFPLSIYAQQFPCDGKIYFFRTVGDSTYIAYIDNYITPTPVVENVCNLTAMGVANQNALAANPFDGHLYFMTLNNYNLFKIDASCNRTLVCHSVANSHRGCFDHLGRYWVIVGSDLEAFDITTCSVVKGPYPLALTPGADIAFSMADCHLYMSSENELIKIDTNGNIVYSNNVGFGAGTGYGGIGIGVDGSLYGIPNIFDTIILNKIDLNTMTPAGVAAAFSTSVANPCGCDMATFPCTVLNAAFTADPTFACQPVDVHFENQSSGLVNNWVWDFGDGTLDSTHVSPQHTYADTGTYTVTLIVYAYSSCMYIAPDTFSIDIVVYQTPQADFFAGNACEMEQLLFSDSSTGINITEWQWDFGDGNISNVQHPIHTYQNSGTYDVKLWVRNSFGCSDSIVKTINVHPKPDADFVFQSVCDGLAVPFNDNSTVGTGSNIQLWEWDFDDGNQGAGNTIQHLYDTSGIYQVQLVVETDSLCRDTMLKDVRVFAMPVTAFTFSDICEGTTATFFNNSTISPSDTIESFVWDFGNGSGGVQGFTNVFSMYNQAGIYDVKLVSISTQNCSDSLVQQLTVYDAPEADFTAQDVCLYDSAHFINFTQPPMYGSTAGFYWNFGDGTPVDSLHWDASHLYTSPGTYAVSLIVQNAVLQCADTAFNDVVIYALPQAEFTFINACLNDSVVFTDQSQGNIVSYLWDYGDGSPLDSVINPLHAYSDAGIYNVWHIVSDTNNCVDSVRHNVQTYPLPVSGFTFSNVCLGMPTAFTDISTVPMPGAINQWTWYFGDSTGVSTQQHPVHTYLSDGAYEVTLVVTTQHNCTDSLMQDVVVYPLPEPDFEAPPEGCALFCTPFTDLSTVSTGSIAAWHWVFGNGQTSAVQSPVMCFDNTTQTPVTYDVALTAYSDAGCEAVIEKPDYITVFPKPEAGFTSFPEKTSLLEPLINFSDLSAFATAWRWDFGDNSGSSTEQNPAYNYQDTGWFIITQVVENTYHCIDTATGTVYIEPDWALYIPSGFTPNNDGLNDLFQVKGYGILEYEIYIFCRWGQLVYYSTDMNGGWDGTVKDGKSEKVVPQAVFAYKINFTTVTHRKYARYGHVTVLGAEGY